jgi:phage FluMu protein Com
MIDLVHITFNSYIQMYIAGVTVLHKVFLDIPCMVVYSCKKCSELNYLTPHAFWTIADFDAKCEKCKTINTITLEGELKKQV